MNIFEVRLLIEGHYQMWVVLVNGQSFNLDTCSIAGSIIDHSCAVIEVAEVVNFTVTDQMA